VTQANLKTGFVWHESYMWHDTGNYAGVMPYGGVVQPGTHAENSETKRRFKNLLDVAGLTEQLTAIAPTSADLALVAAVHTRDHIARVKAASDAGWGEAGPFTPVGRGSYEIALTSAGGAVAAVAAVVAGRVSNAYALVRPPGHHAEPDIGKGFCLFANAAIAGRHALDARGLSRIAFVDWDVHHGNGTQAVFWEEPRALTISIHQDRNFPPDSGFFEETGGGAGEGYNINLPMPAGCGNGAYAALFDRVVIPALAAYKPDLIIVPCGFDAGAHDPLGRMMLTSAGFRALAAKLMTAAADLCGGRIVMTHEGGYNPHTVPFNGLAVMEELSGIKTAVDDPFEPLLEDMGGQELQPHQDAIIRKGEELLAWAKSRW
jgi:acetoin utilization deacetylase AcuC-like enzyme